MLSWREYLYNRLVAADIPDLPQAQILAGGSILTAPATRPFLVINLGAELTREVPGTTTTGASIWVHDDKGSYDRIDASLIAVVNTLIGPVYSDGGIYIVWEGTSDDLADDTYNTITKNASFSLVGKRFDV